MEIRSFGTFFLKEIKEKKTARNPKTGEEIPISARRVVTFRPGQKLKAKVDLYNGNKNRDEQNIG